MKLIISSTIIRTQKFLFILYRWNLSFDVIYTHQEVKFSLKIYVWTRSIKICEYYCAHFVFFFFLMCFITYSKHFGNRKGMFCIKRKLLAIYPLYCWKEIAKYDVQFSSCNLAILNDTLPSLSLCPILVATRTNISFIRLSS